MELTKFSAVARHRVAYAAPRGLDRPMSGHGTYYQLRVCYYATRFGQEKRNAHEI